MSGDSAPSREAGKESAARTARSVALRGREGGGTAELGDELQNCLRASCGGGDKPHVLIHADPIARCDTAGEAKRQDWETCNFVAHSLRGEGFDASEDGTGRGTPLVPVAFSCKDYGADAGEVAPTLRSMGHNKSHANAGGQVAIAFNARQDPDHWLDRTGPLDTDGGTQAVSYAIQAGALRTNPASGPDGVGVQADHAYTLEARAEVQAVAFQERGRKDGRSFDVGGDVAYALTAPSGGGRAQERNVLTPTMQVRRLTPTECARLQGFPDDYLDITYRGKPAADGPKYKALGNSWAVPVVRWIGERIQETA